MSKLEGLSEREIHRRTGLHRMTIRKSLDHGDLRGALFLEFRADRMAYGDSVILSEPDEHEVQSIIPNPDYESSDDARYRRAIILRLRELAGVDQGGSVETGQREKR